MAVGGESDIVFADVVVRGAPPGADCPDGPGLVWLDEEEVIGAPGGVRASMGIQVGSGTQLEMSRVLYERNGPVAIGLNDDSSLLLSDAVVRDTRSVALGAEGTEQAAIGLMLFELQINIGFNKDPSASEETESPRAELHRVRFEENSAVAIAAIGPGVSLVGEDVVVSETHRQNCDEEPCPDSTYGTGIVAANEASIELTRFASSRNALCGLQLAYGGLMDLHEGRVSRNVVGVNVQTEGFDIERLTDRVIYEENERNLDSSDLPVPGVDSLAW